MLFLLRILAVSAILGVTISLLSILDDDAAAILAMGLAMGLALGRDVEVLGNGF